MRREAMQHGWPVESPDAYPLVAHRDPDGIGPGTRHLTSTGRWNPLLSTSGSVFLAPSAPAPSSTRLLPPAQRGRTGVRHPTLRWRDRAGKATPGLPGSKRFRRRGSGNRLEPVPEEAQINGARSFGGRQLVCHPGNMRRNSIARPAADRLRRAVHKDRGDWLGVADLIGFEKRPFMPRTSGPTAAGLSERAGNRRTMDNFRTEGRLDYKGTEPGRLKWKSKINR